VTRRLVIVVPVSIFEPVGILKTSAAHLKSLDFGDYSVRILYVFDGDESDERVKALKKEEVEVFARKTSRGRRAGAINDGLNRLKKFNPQFVAIFDVDSRPERDFILKCVERMDGDTFIASTKRRVSNAINIVSKTIEFEYRLIGFFLRISCFKQFNGLIGLLNFKLLDKYRLNEDALTEDADFATRLYAKGYRARVADSILYEQSPVTWKELFSQRKRWYYGGLELWRYLGDVLKCGNACFSISWLLSLTLTYFPLLYLPLLLLSLPSLLVYYRATGLKVYLGMLIHAFILQLASLSAILSFLKKEAVEWKAVRRIE